MVKRTQQKNSIIGIFLLLLTAIIWGFAFLFQSEAMNHIGPLTMNGLRSILAALFLFPCALLFDKIKGRKLSVWGTQERAGRKTLVVGGLLCGIFVTLASTFQQYGLQYTSVGKSGFLTAIYIILVPLLGLVLRKKVGWNGWIAVVVGLIGMFFICVKADESGFNLGDVLTLICSLFFAIHILFVDNFAPKVDGIRLSCIQFGVCGVICTTLAFIFENPQWEFIKFAILSIAFAGIVSAGIGYTLQIIAQKTVQPHVATLLMSLESVFALIAGAMVLSERMLPREYLGCALVFIAVITAQIDFISIIKAKRQAKKQNDDVKDVGNASGDIE